MTALNDINSLVSKIPEETLRLLDSFPEPKILLDKRYRIIAANAAYHREFGSKQKIQGRFCYELSHHYDKPCDQAGETCPLRDSMKTGEPNRVLHVHHTSKGREHVEVEVVPVKDETGKTSYFMETMHSLHHARGGARDRVMVGYSRPFNRMLELAKRVAARESSVLLLGESGTGKELVAHAIHDMSPRASAPLGRFEIASRGTLFLDEVGDIPLSLQVKLLRLMEAGTYRRVGGLEPLRADFRLVAATHRDLAQMVRDGTFRQDLYFRINVFPIHLPPLRERKEDLPMLVENLLANLEPVRKLALGDEAMSALMNHDFPGNVRELRNILERALIMTDGNTIQPQHLYLDTIKSNLPPILESKPFAEIAPLDSLEKRYLAWAMENFQGDRKALAEQLGISERTLYRKLRSNEPSSI
jgi:transcriptional regulator with PAS, ATPase and Fis domain